MNEIIIVEQHDAERDESYYELQDENGNYLSDVTSLDDALREAREFARASVNLIEHIKIQVAVESG